jgi:uncharacterized protein (UPF0335 family)
MATNNSLRSYVDRILNVMTEQDNLGKDKKEIYKEVADAKLDRTVVAQLVGYLRKRAKKPGKFAEQSALFDQYLLDYEGVGTEVAIRETARTPHARRAPNTTEIDADGVIIEPAETGATVPDVVAVAGEGSAPSPSPAIPDTDAPPLSLDVPEAAGDGTGEGGSSALPATHKRFNPQTHFENSKGLLRLHGCQRPELCGSDTPRTKRCFECQLKWADDHGEAA